MPEATAQPELTRQQQREQRRQRRRKRQQRREARARQRSGDQFPPATKWLTNTPFVDVDKRPLHLHNLYRGAAVFVVLSGLSLLQLDLDRLDRRGIASIGVNQSPSMWRTNFWTYVDRARKFHDGIWKDPGVLKIIPSRHFGKPLQTKVDGKFLELTDQSGAAIKAKDMPGVIGYDRNAFFDPDKWLSEPSINWGNSKRSALRNKQPRCLNVMFAVTKIAYSLGFRRLYLLGCDFFMDDHQPYAFAQTKSAAGVKSNNNCYRIMNDMFGMLKPSFDAAGFQIFNCNAESGFAVFPHVSFDDAVADATNAMPPEPWDTNDWYVP